MKALRTVLFGLVLSTAVALAPSARAADVIGYVNLQRAILEVEDGKKAKARLKKTFEEKQAKLQKEEAELEKLRAQLEGADPETADDATKAKAIELQKRFLKLRQDLMNEQQDLKKLESEALSAITDKMRKVIAQMGKKGGYLMIMEAQESSLLFAKPHLDITNEVIRKYNAKYGGK